MKTLRFMLQTCMILLPWQIKKTLLKKIYGYKISDDSYIGVSYVFPKEMVLMAGARIGNLTVVKNLDKLHMGEFAIISNMNWISSHPTTDTKFFRNFTSRKAELSLLDHAAITSRHIIDCTDKVSIGRFSTLAGYNSQVLTHSINLYKSEQSCSPIEIGDYCFIGTRSIILPGVKIANKVVIGAGSIINDSASEEEHLYAGQPARPMKKIDNAKYFRRSIGEVE